MKLIVFPSINQLKLPDHWQHQAVDLLRAGSDVIVSAPTGAGKTYIFELLHQSGHLKGQAVYTVPTRALANDKFAEWKDLKWDVGIATGDVAENIHAPVLVATLETQIERLLRGEGPAMLVIDEYQMIADAARGSQYEGAIALAGEETRLLLLSGSVANPEDVAAWLRRLGRPAEVVITRDRPVPLEEVPFEVLPQRFSRKFDTFWPKFVTAALLGDLAPLLIFAPRRREAESIARKLAAELPQGDPFELTHEQRVACGKDLATLIERRIAFHHSGLSYAARAGVIEPLAKAGQLRVIVATMGLAAGINFSVRSVHVAATKFHDGIAEHSLQPDELLQMFGRAGRRGLDEKGHVITTRQSPTLHDARPARLHRSSILAWPLFLRVMRHAAVVGANPFDEAAHFAERLFAKVPPALGLEQEVVESGPHAEVLHGAKALFGLEASEQQVLNSAGVWERLMKRPMEEASLGEAWLATPDRVAPALASGALAAEFAHGLGRVFKLPASEGEGREHARYGVEVPLGRVTDSAGLEVRPTKALRKLLRLPRRQETIAVEEIEVLHGQHLAEAVAAQVADVEKTALPLQVAGITRDEIAYARFDLANVRVPVYRDSLDRLLFRPHERSAIQKHETAIEDAADSKGRRRDPRPGSPIHAWRALGLIDAAGVPTRRGEIVSFFQHGEGLAIAAALEDESYPAEDLIPHFANLRAGNKFDLPIPCGSERLAATCRAAYGVINHHGYLENGLPVDYGEGAAELLDALMHPEKPACRELGRGVAEGDVSRAYIEWLSLLRRIGNAPDHPWARWQALQAEAARVLRQHTAALRHLFHLDLPPLTNKQKHGKVRHYLMMK